MSPKLSKLQNCKKNLQDALLKYIVVKFHNFTWSINRTEQNRTYIYLNLSINSLSFI